MKKSVFRCLLSIISVSLLLAIMIIPASAYSVTYGYASYDEDTGYASYSNIGYINYNNSTVGYDNENIRNNTIHSFYFGTTTYSFMGDAQVVITSNDWIRGEDDEIIILLPVQLEYDYAHTAASLSATEDYSLGTYQFDVIHTVYTNSGASKWTDYRFALGWQEVSPLAMHYTFYRVQYICE